MTQSIACHKIIPKLCVLRYTHSANLESTPFIHVCLLHSLQAGCCPIFGDCAWQFAPYLSARCHQKIYKNTWYAHHLLHNRQGGDTIHILWSFRWWDSHLLQNMNIDCCVLIHYSIWDFRTYDQYLENLAMIVCICFNALHQTCWHLIMRIILVWKPFGYMVLQNTVSNIRNSQSMCNIY